MKLSKRIAVIALIAVAMVSWSVMAMAQATNVDVGTNAPAGGAAASVPITDLTPLWNALIAVVVPVAIWGIKKISPNIPSLLLPIGATGLGVLSNYLLTLAGAMPHSSWALGALAGAAGVGVREITDQFKKTVKGPDGPPPTPPSPSTSVSG